MAPTWAIPGMLPNNQCFVDRTNCYKTRNSRLEKIPKNCFKSLVQFNILENNRKMMLMSSLEEYMLWAARSRSIPEKV